MLITACFGLGCNLMNLFILNCCCNSKDENGDDMHLFESIASAYKPYSGNKISRSIKSVKSKSIRSSTASLKHSVMDKYDADMEAAGPSADPKEPQTPPVRLLNGTQSMRETDGKIDCYSNSVESPGLRDNKDDFTVEPAN